MKFIQIKYNKLNRLQTDWTENIFKARLIERAKRTSFIFVKNFEWGLWNSW